ncbi:MAG: metal ABC transporter substrate-binding protein [Planctomycetota bacterium]|nr:metal ABC transporter substrate-binding protein [Planctomycetota bacterium]
MDKEDNEQSSRSETNPGNEPRSPSTTYAEYGFENKAPVGWSTGSEVGAGMTPKRRMAVINSIKELGVKAIFVETSVNPKLIREIAREAGVSIGGSLYSDSMGKAGLPGESYIGMMRENTIKIITALK